MPLLYSWARRIADRLLQMAILVFMVVLTVFILVQMAGGDPATLYLGMTATAEQVAMFRQQMGLDRPLPEQFFKLLGQLVQGDFGMSLAYQVPVAELIWQKLPATLMLMVAGYVLAVVIGVSAGVLGAWKQDTPVETTVRVASGLVYAQPEFIVGILILVLAATFVPWLPIVGMGSLQGHDWPAIRETLLHLIGPALALGIARAGIYARMTLAAMLSAMNQEYIVTHRAAGFGSRRIVFVYALRNALLPIVTTIGIEIRFLFAGAVLTEVTFSWPGIGRLIFDGILNRDAPLIIGVFFVVAILTMLINLATDIVYAMLDPRIRTTPAALADAGKV
jgi:peptide/nickel transport system permease protein